MLVLARRVGEKLVIGNEITVEILSISGDVVRIGIDAPRETSIHRYEIFQEIQEANRAAGTKEVDQDAIGNITNRLRKKKDSKK